MKWIESNYAFGISIASTFAVILAVLIFNSVLKRLLAAYITRARTAERIWQAAVLESLIVPLRAMTWIIGLSVAVGILTRDGELTLLTQFFAPTRDVAVIAVIVWFLL